MKRLTIARLTAVVTGVLVAASAILPWWMATFQPLTRPRVWSWIKIYAYGLTHNMSELREYVLKYETDPALMAAARVYLAVTAAACIASAFIKPKIAWKLLLALGILYLLYSLGFIPVIYEGTSRAPTSERFPVQGEILEIAEVEILRIRASFQLGYYLALASSILAIIAGILTRKMVE